MFLHDTTLSLVNFHAKLLYPLNADSHQLYMQSVFYER